MGSNPEEPGPEQIVCHECGETISDGEPCVSGSFGTVVGDYDPELQYEPGGFIAHESCVEVPRNWQQEAPEDAR